MRSIPLSRVAEAAVPTTVHIVERMAPGGIETLVLDMVSGLGGQHRVLSLAGTRADLVAGWPRLARLGDDLEGLGKQPGLSPQMVRQLTARLRAIRAEAVVLHHVGPLLYGGLAARLGGVRRILHVEHDAWHYESARRRHVARMAFALVRPTRVVVSDEIAATVRRRLGHADLHVIAPGIDMDLFRPRDATAARAQLGLQLGLPQTVPLLGTAGRLVAVKSQGTLIEALALLRGTLPSAELVIVGDGPERDALAARAASLGLTHAVHFLGHRDDLAEILPALDVFALPSLNEGLPRSVLEAQAAGVPVVASRVGGLPNAVCPKSGRLVPPGDAAALAQALHQVLVRSANPAQPRGFVAERFALDRTLSAFDHLLTR